MRSGRKQIKYVVRKLSHHHYKSTCVRLKLY